MRKRPLTVLSVAYPFAPVCPNTAGGAEQVLLMLDDALTQAGHRSVVIAQGGSHVAGELVAGPSAPGLSIGEREVGQRQWADLVRDASDTLQPDVVHLHGIDFEAYLPPAGPAVLVTLHLPLSWYSPRALRPSRSRTFLHAVSSSQSAGANLPDLLPPIENGVMIPHADVVTTPRNYALLLTRICAEKGVHLALDAAKRAGVPLVVAGTLFPYDDHVSYFEREVAPRLDAARRFVGAVGGAAKAQLLANARCLIVASTVAETSSLVAREALAAGTPVVAFARGALVDVIEHGRTGFLVDSVDEMADAILRTDTIDPHVCRETARHRFAAREMIERYFALYRALAAEFADQVA